MSLVDTSWVEDNLSRIKLIDCSWHLPDTLRKPHEEYLNHLLIWIKILIKDQTYHTCYHQKKNGKRLFQNWE